ncbi:hypothetical protein OE88DRAFT_1667845 [Heliocybe sulcata]|uniref:AB hydrolase-1 domain-containing protein n=1 Tax=Heliocybe sulcata TaxID=5364 RepID=A0A5C3MY82_9AGAM|nr:hypothetical protein OE88DRAFT_1667845 [Heliocybe sulcata]
MPRERWPATPKSVEFTYSFDRPLRSIATCYISESCAPIKCSGIPTYTLLFAGGISLNQETWVPVIKHLYRIAADPEVNFDILSIWVIERPNHGDSALLNKRILDNHYSEVFPGVQYATCIQHFLCSNILSPRERESLIAVGHSSGAGCLFRAMYPAMNHFPFKAVVAVECPHCGTEAEEWFQLLYKNVIRSSARRPRDWASKEDAMEWMKTHLPWSTFHPDVLAIIEETYFITAPDKPGRIAPKTSVEQEQACFVHDGIYKMGVPYIRQILSRIPVHVISGSVEDIWPRQMYRIVEKNLKEDRDAFASVVTIQGASHYVPVQKPQELATEIARILANESRVPPARL